MVNVRTGGRSITVVTRDLVYGVRQSSVGRLSQELFDMLLGEANDLCRGLDLCVGRRFGTDCCRALDAFDCTSPGRREISPLEAQINLLEFQCMPLPLIA